MKTKSLLFSLVLLFVISCTKKEVNETSTPTPTPVATKGTITVWTKRTDLGIITVNCNGQTKTISSSVSTTPICGTSGCANFNNIPFGQYQITTVAGTSSGNYSNTLSDTCFTLELR